MICLGGFKPRSALVAVLALGMSVTLAATGLAQERPIHLAQNDKAGKLDALKQRDQDLKAARDAQSKSIETEAALKREIEQIGSDRRKLNQDLIDTASRIRGVEAQVTATEARLKPLDEKEANIHRSLEGRRAVIGEVLAALQRIGHRPPPALISSPEDAARVPIAVVTRFIQWFKDFGIPVGGVLVNMVIDPASAGADAAEFVKNRVAMQQGICGRSGESSMAAFALCSAVRNRGPRRADAPAPMRRHLCGRRREARARCRPRQAARSRSANEIVITVGAGVARRPAWRRP